MFILNSSSSSTVLPAWLSCTTFIILKTNQFCVAVQLSMLLLHSLSGSLLSNVAVGVVSCVLMCVGWCSILFVQLHSLTVMSHHYMPTIGPPPTGNACQKATTCTVHGLLLSLSACKPRGKLFHAKKKKWSHRRKKYKVFIKQINIYAIRNDKKSIHVFVAILKLSLI